VRLFFIVMSVLPWPSRTETTFTGTPAASASVAAVSPSGDASRFLLSLIFGAVGFTLLVNSVLPSPPAEHPA
jgi:hypothetical protein